MKYIRNSDGLFVCPTCGDTKANQNTMHYHMKKHSNSLPFECKFCKKGFLQKQTLDLHIRSRHPESDSDKDSVDPAFECPFTDCKFTSMTKGNLRTHCLRNHFQKETNSLIHPSKDNEISCTKCNREFSSKGSYYYHCLDCIDIDPSDLRFSALKSIL